MVKFCAEACQAYISQKILADTTEDVTCHSMVAMDDDSDSNDEYEDDDMDGIENYDGVADDDDQNNEHREDGSHQKTIHSSKQRHHYDASVCHVVRGDVFLMDCVKNVKYDRIYVGAEAPESLMDTVKSLLNPFGIAVVRHDQA